MLTEESLRRIMAEGERPLKELARARNTHPSTLTRWILRGGKSPSGSTVKLEAIRRPGGWATSLEAVERFFLALNGSRQTEHTPAIKTVSQRRRESEAAERALIEQGA